MGLLSAVALLASHSFGAAGAKRKDQRLQKVPGTKVQGFEATCLPCTELCSGAGPDGREDVAPRPPGDVWVELEVPPAGSLAQHEHEADAIVVLKRLVKGKDGILAQNRLVKENDVMLPLLIRMLDPEVEGILVGRTLKAAALKLLEDLLGAWIVVEFDEFNHALNRRVWLDRESLVRDPVV